MVALTSMLEPAAALIVTGEPFLLIVNCLLTPSNSFSNLSRTSNSPKCHPENLSESILSTVIWNSSNVKLVSVGIPEAPPVATVKT